MKLSFHGSARMVTGSNVLLETETSRILIDCGLFQGSASVKSMNFDRFRYDPTSIDCVVLTHAHIDHSGRIPLLYRRGFRGTILCTRPTRDLCSIMLPDSGHIQESETAYKNRKRERSGLPPLEPLYEVKDAEECLQLFRDVQYHDTIRLDGGISLRFRDAGHLLGSAIVELWVKEEKGTVKLVFTGDIGKRNTPIVNDPETIEETDYLVMESTYGDRAHETQNVSEGRLFRVIEETLEGGGTVIIPSFAVGRTQEIIYKFNRYMGREDSKKKITSKVPVYIDSPLSVAATEVFRNNIEAYDDEAKGYLLAGDHPLDFTTLSFTRTVEESKALNLDPAPKIIISSSGMCEAGRIRHHLKHHLWRSEDTVLFIGYQAEGTLGRRIVDGEKTVSVLGERVDVKARVESIDGFSGHGDMEALEGFVAGIRPLPKKVFLVHGEERQAIPLRDRLKEKLQVDVEIPNLYDLYKITCDECQSITPETDRDIRKFSHKRLELLNSIKKSQSMIQDASESLSYDIMNNLNDKQVDELIDIYREIHGNVDKIMKTAVK